MEPGRETTPTEPATNSWENTMKKEPTWDSRLSQEQIDDLIEKGIDAPTGEEYTQALGEYGINPVEPESTSTVSEVPTWDPRLSEAQIDDLTEKGIYEPSGEEYYQALGEYGIKSAESAPDQAEPIISTEPISTEPEPISFTAEPAPEPEYIDEGAKADLEDRLSEIDKWEKRDKDNMWRDPNSYKGVEYYEKLRQEARDAVYGKAATSISESAPANSSSVEPELTDTEPVSTDTEPVEPADTNTTTSEADPSIDTFKEDDTFAVLNKLGDTSSDTSGGTPGDTTDNVDPSEIAPAVDESEKARIEELEKQLADKNAELDMARKESERLEKEMQTLQGENAELEKRNKNLITQSTRILADARRLRDMVDEVERLVGGKRWFRDIYNRFFNRNA